jgi:hypothetical protein
MDADLATTTFGPMENYRPRSVIAFTGPAGAGKSTAAAHLAAGHGYARIRFADPLKAMLRALYHSAGLSEAETERRIEGDLKEVADPILRGRTPRQAMQWLGTEWGRMLIAEDFWTELWRLRAAAHDHVVVEDCRFDNEAATVRSAGGKVVRIDCPWASSASGGKHSSEAGSGSADGAVSNAEWQEPELFLSQVSNIVQAMTGGR